MPRGAAATSSRGRAEKVIIDVVGWRLAHSEPECGFQLS